MFSEASSCVASSFQWSFAARGVIGKGLRAIRCAAACALVAASYGAHAGPPPGTIISNQASASGQAGPTPFTAISNTVNATVGGGAVGGFSAVLAATTLVDSQPGATVLIAHTLANTGAFADTYTITATDLNLGSWSFTSITLFPDANGDGQPDGVVPLANPQALAPGQVLRFVARLVVPAGAPLKTANDVRISATSAGGAAIAPIIDRVSLPDSNLPRDCGLVTKMLSKDRGPSPAGPVTVTLAYGSCDQARSRLNIIDRLPAGMRYVAGSGRWSGTGATVLTDAIVGTDRQGTAPAQIAYDFNATVAGAVTTTVYNLPAQTSGYVTFDVEIDGGIATGTTIPNGATYTFFDASGAQSNESATNIASYIVTGKADFDLTGDKLPTAMPGARVSFTNVLNNRGDVADTFDITLAASTFPPGTTFALFKSDGVTPLADTNGNGTPDTGIVAAGGSYRIVVRAQIPESAPPAAYKVTKTARSGSMPSRSASADDSVDTLATQCHVTMDPDNSAQVGFGQHVTYTHYLTNRGNCQETVRAMVDYLGDSRPGWTSAAYIDNPVAGGGSLPGVLDRTDTKVTQGWSATLQPGESLRLLVDVLAPTREAAAALQKRNEKAAKASVESNLTTLVITSASSGALVVRDTTTIADADGPGQPDNVIRNFTDSSYAAPTFWGVIGGSLWLRADAASCNAAPDVVESRLVTITGPDGEREEITATETGPNTGIFLLPPLPIRSPPVVALDRIVEGRANDVYDIELVGCGRRIATVVTLMQPVSVVFDSRTNDPVAGATVTLVGASGAQCLSTAAPVSPNPVVTGDDGRFSFPPLTGAAYCLSVKAPNGYSFRSKVPWPLLPPGRNLQVTGNLTGGSYGDPFPLPAGGLLVIDLPVDPAAQDGLFVQKDASRTVAELGDFVDYRVQVRNGTGNLLDRADVTLTDDLPAGFAYVPGTARLDGKPIADPPGGKGPRLTFSLGHFDRGQQLTATYRVRVGPGSMQGDGVNRAQARYAANGSATLSNIATAKVQVTGGVFSDKGFILGKVFLDCNANGVQDKGEPGVPGVRLVLEDGTFIITDGGGKYSFYGISNRTHVVKADRTTLPAGARLETTGTRNLGDAGSRIVDLKAGEMQRADFAVAGCDASVVEEVKSRAAKVAGTDELGALVGTQLTTEPRAFTDVKTLPASGMVEITAPNAMPGTAPVAPAAAVLGAPFSAVLPAAPQSLPSPAPKIDAPRERQSPVALEALVPGLDDKLGFIGVSDGQTMSFAQATIRVKGAAGATFRLEVNGVHVPEARVGKRATLADKGVQAWEYIGIDLKPGENTLSLTQVDSFGNARGSETIRVIAPDKLGKLSIELPASGGIAYGKTPTLVVVKLADANGVPVTVRTAVTLEASRGRWQVEDLDLKEPGVQAFVENGRGEFALLPPLEPGESQIVVTSGEFKAQARLDFLPELRDMIATGVIEGVVNMRNVNTRALTPARESDGFEQELRQLSREWNAGKTDAGARAAFYLKGKIKGEYLLTAAYDSDKDTKERLFRDIQPDEFYPVYGDSGARGYDAQSTSKLYVRIDHRRSYLLWGDFNTNATSEVRKLANYSRSLTGAKQHFENERVSVNAFASRDTTRQVIEELRANGTSGPFQLGTPGALVNSEKIEIITRDRNQPALIISTVAQTRFADYEVEALTGRILFKAPVPSVDRDLNPVFVRVTYEVDQGGEQFWVAGVDAQVKVTDRIEVGGVYVKDKNPLLPFTLAGANLVVKLGAGTYVIGEVARVEHGVEDIKGDAGRIELKHESKDLKAQAYVARTDRGFDNPGSYLTLGRSEAGGKLEYKLTPRTTIRGEALRTEDVVTGAVRDGAALSVQHQIADHLTFELGLRHAAEKGTVSPVPAVEGQPAPQPVPDEVTTVRARLTGSVPGVEGASVYGEAEVDVKDTDRRVLAAGGEYLLPNKSRIYARHEFISSITGPYGLNQTERQNTSAVGIDTEYMKDGHLFSEYRVRDAISGGDVEAALGLKNLWSLAPGLRLGTTFERVKSLAGTGQGENTALALALEYTANPLWKGSTRLELRDAATQESILFTVGLAARLNRDWTALARNAYTLTRNKTGGAEHLVDRMQAGLAWRDNETNKWNVLARVESRVENDDTQENMQLKSSTQIVSIHADWQPRRPFLLTGRYAAKWSQDKSNGLSTRYRAQVVGGRATWEFAPKWDIGFVSSVLVGDSSASRQYGVGLELGYLMATNLWVSAGYNFFGYRDADLAGADYTSKGPYVRLRYKFDESVFGEHLEAPARPAAAIGATTTTTTTPLEARPAIEARETSPSGAFVPVAPGGGSSSQPGHGEDGPL
ncbi:MAG: SdrD B-like domain-containing protein [Usitatibacter sp.]